MGQATVALYVRIPADLSERLRAVTTEGRSYTRKGDLQRFVVDVLTKALPVVEEKPAKKAKKPAKKAKKK